MANETVTSSIAAKLKPSALRKLIILADAVTELWSCGCYDGQCDRCMQVVQYRNERQNEMEKLK